MIGSIHKGIFLCRTLRKTQCYQKKRYGISKGIIPLHGGIIKKRSVCVGIIRLTHLMQKYCIYIDHRHVYAILLMPQEELIWKASFSASYLSLPIDKV